ncbi:MAG: hypothetical protein IPP32_07970 [Bacteroidetes bacterium]|nr:hypothetical protein [Bacteroidota bacterium]
MKIRIRGNSIRLRLSKSEIDRFGEVGNLEEKTEFPNGTFYYALSADKSATELTAQFEASRMTVFVPLNIQKEWTTTDRVGFENKMKTASDKQLFILIEKDFVCLDHTTEDQSDNYPNPNRNC